MAAVLTALVAGLTFGIGLTVAQMVNPLKVIGFLDLFGTWDPSLAFVMGAAVPVAAAGFAIARRRGVPLFARALRWPASVHFDARAACGGALFGIGWGLSGYCPGPAVASLGFGHAGTWLFVAAMVAGMAIFEGSERFLSRRAGALTAP